MPCLKVITFEHNWTCEAKKNTNCFNCHNVSSPGPNDNNFKVFRFCRYGSPSDR